MLRATLKSLLSRKLRLILSGLAVVLGVMFVSGAFVLTDSLSRSFDQLFAGIFANTDVRVTATPKLAGQEPGADSRAPTVISASVVDQLRGLTGTVADATGGVFVDGARTIGASGKVVTTVGPPRFGVDWRSQAPNLVLREGVAPTADNQIAINAGLAKDANLHVGDQVGVLTNQPGKRTFSLVGIFGYTSGQDSLGGAQMVAFTTPVAQDLMLRQPNVYSQITVTAAPGVSPDQLRDRVSAELGPGFQVKTGKQLADEQATQFTNALRFFNYILIGFAAVALFVAIFLILNTFSIIVAQRTRELALMRAIGADRGQVIRSVLLEAVVIGLLASVIGLALGFGVGAGLAKVFSSFAGGGGLSLSLGLPVAAVVSAFGVGIGITVLAALIPAVRAARIPPVAAMRDAATADKPLTRLTITGTAVFGAGAVLLAVGLTGNGGGATLWTILGGVLLTFIGTALLTPLIARPVAGVIGRLFSWSVPGTLGRLNAGRNPRRTAITAAALMVGIALITGINTVITSAKHSITRVADQQAHVDLIISGDQGATFDPAVLTQVSHVDGVQATTGLYQDAAAVNGDRTFVGAFSDMSVVPAMFTLSPAAGVIDAVNTGQAVVDEKTAGGKGLHVGSPVTVQLVRGDPLRLTVSGIYHDSDLFNGFIIPVAAVSDFQTVSPSMGFIQVKPDASVDAVKSTVNGLLADSPEVSVGDRSQYLAQQTAPVDQVLLMVQILLALAILIAVLGVINTLALSVIERTRELGLLRAVGLSRTQTMRMITVEAVVISVFGAVLGLAVGARPGRGGGPSPARPGHHRLRRTLDPADRLPRAGRHHRAWSPRSSRPSGPPASTSSKPSPTSRSRRSPLARQAAGGVWVLGLGLGVCPDSLLTHFALYGVRANTPDVRCPG